MRSCHFCFETNDLHLSGGNGWFSMYCNDHCPGECDHGYQFHQENRKKVWITDKEYTFQ